MIPYKILFVVVVVDVEDFLNIKQKENLTIFKLMNGKIR